MDIFQRVANTFKALLLEGSPKLVEVFLILSWHTVYVGFFSTFSLKQHFLVYLYNILKTQKNYALFKQTIIASIILVRLSHYLQVVHSKNVAF
jgi:hypothetical protein